MSIWCFGKITDISDSWLVADLCTNRAAVGKYDTTELIPRLSPHACLKSWTRPVCDWDCISDCVSNCLYSHLCSSYTTCGYHLKVVLIPPCTLKCVAVFMGSNFLRTGSGTKNMVFTPSRCMGWVSFLYWFFRFFRNKCILNLNGYILSG